jgi:hypothetical protein
MQKSCYVSCVILLFLVSCKNKKSTTSDENASFFPVLSFIKSQVAHVDTSVYRIIKVTKVDSLIDTSFLKREEFKEAAKDFLNLPDISSDPLKDDYKETELYDQDLEQVVLNYMPSEAGEEITRQEVLIKPDPNGDKVKSIFVNQSIPKEDSTINKILFWEVDKKFRVVTTVQKENAKERTEVVEVVWNDFPSQ